MTRLWRWFKFVVLRREVPLTPCGCGRYFSTYREHAIRGRFVCSVCREDRA